MGTRSRAVSVDAAATRERILDAAEGSFAARGFGGASLRAITAGAGVNLAAANYHFGSKAGLLEAVLRRRIEPLNAERLRRLAALVGPRGGATVAEILRTFIDPLLARGRERSLGGATFLRLLGRCYAEPDATVRALMPGLHQEVKLRYGEAFALALPALAPEDLFWRMHFALGTVAYAMASTDALRLLENCPYCDPGDVEGTARRLVAFLAAGMQAPQA